MCRGRDWERRTTRLGMFRKKKRRKKRKETRKISFHRVLPKGETLKGGWEGDIQGLRCEFL
jgi:hypothetical protein